MNRKIMRLILASEKTNIFLFFAKFCFKWERLILSNSVNVN